MSQTLNDLKRAYYLANAPGALVSDTLADLEYKFFASAGGVDRGTAYKYTASTAPLSGFLNIQNDGGADRTIRINKRDANGIERNLSIILPGDNLTITDDPETPPITGFARYMVVSMTFTDPLYIITAVRKDTEGSTSAPAEGTSVRTILSFSAT